MKKLSFFLFALFFLFSCSSRAQVNEQKTDQFVAALGANRFDEAIAMCDSNVKKITKEALQMGWQQITAAFGVYQSHTVKKAAGPDPAGVIVHIKFARKEQDFVCGFNSQHQINGFLMAPPKPSQAEEQAAASAFPEADVDIPVAGGSLKGSLMKPEAYVPGKTPVALILAGSGATDRNCNGGSNLHTDAYKMLAEKLAEKGIASLRYDKRLVGKSMGFTPDESKLRFDDYVNDAVAASRFLQDGSFGSLFIIGHSEGALVGTLAAGKAKAAAFISLCGAGENIALTLKRQLNDPAASAVIDVLKSGQVTNDVPAGMEATFRASVQPYLISWMKYDPATEIARLKIPVLIIGGTTDLQVPVADAEMLKKAAPGATLRIIDGMNHILKDAPSDPTANMVTYTQASLPLNAELTAAILQFLDQK